MRTSFILAAATALLASSAASAVTYITQTLNFDRGFSAGLGSAPGGSQTIAFNLFAGSPALLKGVSLVWTPSVSGSIVGRTGNGLGNGAATVGGRLSGSFSLSSSSGAFSTISNTFSTNQVELALPARTSFTLTPLTAAPTPTSFTSPTTLDTGQFLGSGTSNAIFTLAAVSRITTVAGPTQYTGHSGNAGGTLSIIYEVIPEPGTWAMLIAGFGLVGASMRRRRAATA